MEISEAVIARSGAEVEALYHLSKTLNTGLDRRAIAIVLELIEMGVNPESIVDGREQTPMSDGICALSG
jgi:hypothetical protein